MIRFFRSIRQNLLAQGRVTRYLYYAVGQVVPVVTEILPALLLNNWNADRKPADNELAASSEMRENL